MYDVVVAGAGPAGSAAARRCAELGLKTLCIEEHSAAGIPVQCAGLLSTAALSECRVSDRSVLHRVSGAYIHADDSCVLSFDAKKTMAHVIDRASLDREMVEMAAKAGVDFQFKTYAYGVEGQHLLTSGLSGLKRIPFNVLIAADGPRSPISASLGMGRQGLFLSGIQAEIPFETDPACVTLYPSASPDFFGWCIPAGKGRARVGLCGMKDVPGLFARFIEPFGSECLHLVTGTLPLGVRDRTYGHRTLIVGDAAGFAKPTSGGGVYTGVRSGVHAAETAAWCCGKNRYSDADLSRYEKAWKDDFGSELSFGLRLYQMRRRLGPSQITSLCRAFNDPEIIQMIVEYGDIDRPGRLMRRFIARPRLYRQLASVLGSEIRSLLI